MTAAESLHEKELSVGGETTLKRSCQIFVPCVGPAAGGSHSAALVNMTSEY